MPNIIDLREINNDFDFEVFCYLILQKMDLKGVTAPAIGQDGRRDCIVEAPGFMAPFRWLVSCKFSHGDRSFGSRHDIFDADSVRRNGCHGKIFMFSNPYTESLRHELEEDARLAHQFIQIWNGRDIEAQILSNIECMDVVRQFLPISFDRLLKLRKVRECNQYCSGNLYITPYRRRNGEIGHMESCDYCHSYRDTPDNFPGDTIQIGSPIVVSYEGDF